MGNKISWEDAERLGALKTGNDSVYARQNKYGYRINVNHAAIKPLYEKCKRALKIMVMSDEQRLAFEAAIFRKIENGGIRIE